MPVIHSFSLPFDSSERISLPKKSKSSNRFTAILGVNGTGKSSLLRGLMEDSLTSLGISKVAKGRSVSAELRGKPSRVIALSATPNDRFPSKRRYGESGKLSRYDSDYYRYIGPRSARNIISRSQSIDTLILALITSESIPDKSMAFLQGLSVKTTIPLQFTADIELRSAVQSGPEWIKRYFDGIVNQENKYQMITSAEKAYLQSNQFWSEVVPQICRAADVAQRFSESAKIFVSLEGGLGIDAQGLDREALLIGVKYGLFRFRKLSLGGFPVEHFSAGQWSLFSTLVSLAVMIEDDAVVLIDEPENALHPSWQREYIEDLRLALDGYAGCHVLIATHSPLLIGALNPHDSDLVLIKKADGLLSAVVHESPMGWQANDVLEEIFDLSSTRAPVIEDLLNDALGLIAGGIAGRRLELRKLASTLSELADHLPEDDVAKNVIAALVRISKQG